MGAYALDVGMLASTEVGGCLQGVDVKEEGTFVAGRQRI